MKTYTFHDDNDRPIVVRYDFDEGEEQWFDAKAGVGNPGSDPKVEITEVQMHGGPWETPDTYPQLNLAAMEQEILEYEMSRFVDEEAAYYDSLERGYAQDRI